MDLLVNCTNAYIQKQAISNLHKLRNSRTFSFMDTTKEKTNKDMIDTLNKVSDLLKFLIGNYQSAYKAEEVLSLE